MYTSGTTGFPKGVARDHSLIESLVDRHRRLAVTERDVFIDYLPLFHIFGYVGGALGSLMAGYRHVLTETFDPDEALDLIAREGGTQVRKYWELGGYGDEIGDLALAAKSYRAALEESVNDQLMTDVPLGSHLSGGMDSSSVAYAASRHLDGLPVFTGAFGDETVDETSYARSVAEAIGAKVHETTIDPRRIPSEFGRIVWHLDEPKGGPGVVPAWFVAELASKHVRVVLAGHRRAPDRHHRIADELLDQAAVPFDGVSRGVEVAGEELADVLGVAALGDRREADEVGEQHRHQPSLHGRHRSC